MFDLDSEFKTAS